LAVLTAVQLQPGIAAQFRIVEPSQQKDALIRLPMPVSALASRSALRAFASHCTTASGAA
jgi:hypothetical protein